MHTEYQETVGSRACAESRGLVVPGLSNRDGRDFGWRGVVSPVGRSSLALVAVVSAGIAAHVGIGSAVAAPTPGKIVLVARALSSVDFARDGLYVMNADGSGVRQITHDVVEDDEPHWSPDGRLVAFVDVKPTSEWIVVVRGDGSGRRVLGRGISLASPNPWSPDGRRIAWGGCDGLCVYDLASARLTAIALGRSEVFGFSWSPDGRKLAVHDSVRGLVVFSRTGKQLAVLARNGAFPAFSPDGKKIAFLTRHKLEIVPAAGGRPRLLDRHAGGAPSWSPDGRRLLYTDTRLRTGHFAGNVRVVDTATGTNIRVDDTGGIARWSPDGSTIAYGRYPTSATFGQDVWLAYANGTRRSQLTDEFPNGLVYTDLDWTSGSVPNGKPVPKLDTVPLTVTAESKLGYGHVWSLNRAGSPKSVAYRSDAGECDPDAETESATFIVWDISTQSSLATTTSCQELSVESYAVTSSLDAWMMEPDPSDGLQTVRVARPGTETVIASWDSGYESPDIGWRSGIGPLVSDGTTIVFETRTADGGVQLWRIADGDVPHAVQIPLPSNVTGLIDADAGRVLVGAGKNSYAVIGMDGAVLARVSSAGSAALGGDLLGIASGDTLRVYDTNSGSLRYQLPLTRTTGYPQLLSIGNGYAAYTSGIALHLLRLNDGKDSIADLPGETGPPVARFTQAGLFIGYERAYLRQSGRLLFVAGADMP